KLVNAAVGAIDQRVADIENPECIEDERVDFVRDIEQRSDVMRNARRRCLREAGSHGLVTPEDRFYVQHGDFFSTDPQAVVTKYVSWLAIGPISQSSGAMEGKNDQNNRILPQTLS